MTRKPHRPFGTAPKAKMACVKLEDVYDDGGYSALVSFYGLEFAVHFVQGEIRVYGTNTQRGGFAQWAIKSAAKEVYAFAKHRIDQQGPAFLAKHAELYGLNLEVFLERTDLRRNA